MCHLLLAAAPCCRSTRPAAPPELPFPRRPFTWGMTMKRKKQQPQVSRPQKSTKPASSKQLDQPNDPSRIVEGLLPLAVPCADLRVDPANAMRHPEPNLEAIRGSLQAYGQRKRS